MRKYTILEWLWLFILFTGITSFFAVVARAEQVTLEVTGYCTCTRCCGPGAKGITASGKPAVAYRTVAAPRDWKYGTQVKVPGWGTGIVQDRGGMIRSKGQKVEKGRTVQHDRIDLCFPDHQSALRWGRRVIRCEVSHVQSKANSSGSVSNRRSTIYH